MTRRTEAKFFEYLRFTELSSISKIRNIQFYSSFAPAQSPAFVVVNSLPRLKDSLPTMSTYSDLAKI